MASSSSAASKSLQSSSATRSRRRRWTREQLLQSLQMLDILSTPLPPTLPPSPPASRAASPAPGSKRKPDPSSSSDLDAAKRPRTSSIVDRSQHQSSQPSSHLSHGQPFQVPPPPTHYSATSRPSRTEPCEDGEVREEPVAGARGSSAPFPRPLQRRPKFSIKVGDTMHDKYRNAGRMLKYSGDARFWSTFPPSHKEYRPLSKPPPVDSSYHRDAQLMARLELLDALICFTYALWCKDYARDAKNVETWKTAIPFLAWCKNKWTKEATIDNDDELALSGLILWLDTAVRARILSQIVQHTLIRRVDAMKTNLKSSITTLIAESEAQPVSTGSSSTQTPTMLPSPTSTNSTPVNRDEGTPNVPHGRPHPPQLAPADVIPLPLHLDRMPANITPQCAKSITSITEPINLRTAGDITEAVEGYQHICRDSPIIQKTCNLNIMRRCFPRTWTRVAYSNLRLDDEHLPDLEDDDCELFWPTNSFNGDGIGWICLLGKSMLREFGQQHGYLGLEGVIPKPKPEETEGISPPYNGPRTGAPAGYGPRPSGAAR